jgi:hypothetical protein
MSEVKIVRGIRGRASSSQPVAVDKVEAYAVKYNNCYEFLTEEFHRLYLDIDFRIDPNMTEEQFGERDAELLRIIEENFADEVAIATSSSFAHHKISWRVYFPKQYADKKTNKEFAKRFQSKVPADVVVDQGVYGTTQKMRMIHSSKDDENRPLKLVKGKFEDTLISYIPKGCEKVELADPKKEKETAKKCADETKDNVKRNSALLQYVAFLTPKRLADYSSWITLGLIFWNSKLPVETWDEVSQKADNYQSGKCAEKWKTFRDSENPAGIPKILEWIAEDTPEIYGKMYPQMKSKFEEEHFKVMNPAQYVRLHTRQDGTKTIQLGAELLLQYANLHTLEGDLFITKWTKDETIRCYEALGFYPKDNLCPPDEYNLFGGVKVLDIDPSSPAPDISGVLHQMRCLVGHNEEHFQYFVRWVAHIFQFPEVKAGVYLVFNGSHGTGKDTFGEFLGSILGNELYFANARLEEDLCGKFNFISSRRLLVHCQEVSRESAKKYKDDIKRLVTQKEAVYEDKGAKKVAFKSFERYIFTTNDDVPMFLEQGERRACIFTPSGEHCKDWKYWDKLIGDYENPAIQRAFYDYLMSIDLTGWKIGDRPITDTYKDVAIVSAPPLARFFGDLIADGGGTSYCWTPTQLCEALNERLRYNVTRIGVGKEIKPYILHRCIQTSGGHHGPVRYALDNEKTKEYLQSKGWWFEDPRGPEDTERGGDDTPA